MFPARAPLKRRHGVSLSYPKGNAMTLVLIACIISGSLIGHNIAAYYGL
jgi:hypothetical protein